MLVFRDVIISFTSRKPNQLQEDVMSVFADRKDMALKKEHLAAWQAWYLDVPAIW